MNPAESPLYGQTTCIPLNSKVQVEYLGSPIYPCGIYWIIDFSTWNFVSLWISYNTFTTFLATLCQVHPLKLHQYFFRHSDYFSTWTIISPLILVLDKLQICIPWSTSTLASAFRNDDGVSIGLEARFRSCTNRESPGLRHTFIVSSVA